MIHYTEVPEKNMIVAELRGTKYDAIFRMDKIIQGFDLDIHVDKLDGYYMPDKFVTSVTLQPGDEYNYEVGKTEAKKKLMSHYYASIDKRVNRFKESIVKCAMKISSEKFEKST